MSEKNPKHILDVDFEDFIEEVGMDVAMGWQMGNNTRETRNALGRILNRKRAENYRKRHP